MLPLPPPQPPSPPPSLSHPPRGTHIEEALRLSWLMVLQGMAPIMEMHVVVEMKSHGLPSRTGASNRDSPISQPILTSLARSCTLLLQPPSPHPSGTTRNPGRSILREFLPPPARAALVLLWESLFTFLSLSEILTLGPLLNMPPPISDGRRRGVCAVFSHLLTKWL